MKKLLSALVCAASQIPGHPATDSSQGLTPGSRERDNCFPAGITPADGCYPRAETAADPCFPTPRLQRARTRS